MEQENKTTDLQKFNNNKLTTYKPSEIKPLLSSAQSPEDIEVISKLVPNKVEAIAEAVPMCVLKHEVDQDKIKYLIVQEITKASLMMNVANNINTPQIQFTAETIIEKYPTESVEDVILCLRRGCQGYYGSVYHQFDTSVIMGWMEKHIEEKAVYMERNNQTDKLKHEENKVDYKAYLENQERRFKKEQEDKKKEREYWINKANEIVNPRRKEYTVDVMDDKSQLIETVEKVMANSPEEAQQMATDYVRKKYKIL